MGFYKYFGGVGTVDILIVLVRRVTCTIGPKFDAMKLKRSFEKLYATWLSN